MLTKIGGGSVFLMRAPFFVRFRMRLFIDLGVSSRRARAWRVEPVGAWLMWKAVPVGAMFRVLDVPVGIRSNPQAAGLRCRGALELGPRWVFDPRAGEPLALALVLHSSSE